MSGDADWKRMIESSINDLREEVRDDSKAQWAEINVLKAWRNWVMGSVATIGIIVGALGKHVAVWLKGVLTGG